MGLDLGFLEILVILVVALLVVGPEKLPEYARKFGKMVRDLRKMTKNFTGEVTKSLELEDDFDDLKSTAQGLKGSLDEESLKIKNALDMEADEIAKTIDNEINDVQKTMDAETAELSAMLEKESLELNSTARDIKDPLATGAQEVSMALNEGADKLSKSLNLDNDSPSKKTRTTAARKTTAKKAAETPEKLDTVENSEPQEESVAAPAGETALPDEKKDTEEAGK